MTRPRVDNQYAQAVLAFRYQFLFHALQLRGGNRTETAKALGMPRSALYQEIRRLKITVPAPGRAQVPA